MMWTTLPFNLLRNHSLWGKRLWPCQKAGTAEAKGLPARAEKSLQANGSASGPMGTSIKYQVLGTN